MPVSSQKCIGRNLYNHLKQKNINMEIEYCFDKVKLSWDGSLTIFGTRYETTNNQTKLQVLEELMKQSNDFIWSKLNEKKK